MGKPTTFVTAVWIFQFVSLDIGHRHRKQNCYQRAFATPTKLDVIVDQAKTEAKKSPNYKDLSLRALPRPRMNAKGAFTSFGQNAQLPYTVTKVCWFLMESFLMEIKSAAKFCTRHLLLEPKQCESAWAEYSYLSAVGGVCFCAIKIRWSRFVHPIEYIII